MHRHWRRTTACLAATLVSLALIGCVETGGGYRGGGSYRSDSPNLGTLDQGQRRALKQGCMDRYGQYTRKYEQCVNGYRHSEDALIDGCYKRYKGNDKKLRRCLDGL